MSEEARRVAERTARLSYGRLVGALAARGGDIIAAEDALADAMSAALAAWPETGIPDNPEGWLFTAARRGLGKVRARAATAAGAIPMLTLLADERAAGETHNWGDKRLELMFAATHPAIDPDLQAPLMLQVVLGLDAARIAACFLTSPAAMGRALGRAKVKVKAAGIGFAVPEPGELPLRLDAVLNAIYAAYGAGWEDVAACDPKRRGLSEEAIWLARVVCELLPDTAEAKGLLALMLYCEARGPARRTESGVYVPLSEQKHELWSRPMIAEAEALLRAAARSTTPGRFQTEAAIQSLHVEACVTATDLRRPLAALYDLLVELCPAPGARVARAVAWSEAGRATDALAMLDAISGCESYQPWWAARAHVLGKTGDDAAAVRAAKAAAGLTSDPSVRAFLIDKFSSRQD